MKTLIALFLVVLFCSCERKEVMPKQRTLNISFGAEVRTLDPRVGGEYPTAHLIRMLFDGLMRRDKNGVIAPAVAESYVVSDDLKTYTFILRKTYWSDGKPVTAYDFEYAWKKSLDPKTLSHGAQNFYFIKNAKLSVEGKVSVNDVGIRAIDNQTFEVKLEYPAPYFLEVLACTLFHPIPKHLDKKDPNWVHHTDEKFVSNGPFKLQSWKHGDFITVEKNPYYWDKENVHLTKIKVNFIEDAMTQVYMYEKNKLDWLGSPLNKIPPEAKKNLKLNPSYVSVPSPMIYWFFLNCEVFPFSNKKIRQAFSYAMNRNDIVEHIFEGEGTVLPAYGIVAPCFELGNFPCFENGNFEEAKKLFNEALEELNLTHETFSPINIKYASGVETLSRTAQAVQELWQKTFGINVFLEQADWPVHFTAIQKGNYQIGIMGWISFLVDPIYMLQIFKYKHDMVNMSNWESQRYIDFLEASNFEADPEKRNQILIAAEKVLMDEMPIIPICYLGMDFCKKTELVGVNLPPSGEIDFKFANFSQ